MYLCMYVYIYIERGREIIVVIPTHSYLYMLCMLLFVKQGGRHRLNGYLAQRVPSICLASCFT